jgi:hypothetical protein
MRYISLISSSSSGKLGGLVASGGRGVNQLRARIIPRQSLTGSASQARAITGGLPALWRNLTSAEQLSWSKLATEIPTKDKLGQAATLSGYALYIACNRRLITVGITEALTLAPETPSIPPIMDFSATPIYAAPGTSGALLDIVLSTCGPLPNAYLPVVRASAAVSAVRFNIRASNLRVIEAGLTWASQPHSVLAAWKSIYGTVPPIGSITFELALVDPASGIAGAGIRTTANYSYLAAPTPTAGDVTIQVEGVTVAVLADTYIQVDSVNVAE